ncbi:MAG: UvrD/REP helicase [Methanocalculus sp. 52_23]|nr:MAG: UvrD/REP helicase [Methanocalculus sp. 52_23]
MSLLLGALTEKILNEPKPLSDQQRRAVLCDRSHIRIIAGAGAGKTETLTRRIVYHLIVQNVEPSAIVAFTFTEKAAQSMKSRVYERVKHLGGDEICAHLGEMFIGTIHGYCYRLLEEYFGYGDWGVLDEKQEMAYLMRVGWAMGLGRSGYYATNCEDFLNALNVYYGEMIPEENLRKKEDREFLEKLHRYEASLNKHKRLTFNRMVQLAVENLQRRPEVAEHIKHLIVDEYQDINRAQEELIRLIGQGGGVFVVGDPRQTIYQWRGSDERCFEEFATRYPEAVTIHITQNRRSTVAVIETANGFSDTFEGQHYDHMDPVRCDQGGVYLTELESNIGEVDWIADQIQALINEERCNYNNIALLFRSVNTSAPPFIDEFRRRGIPFIVGGKVGLFRRQEILGIGQLFAWLWEDGFWQQGKWSKLPAIQGEDLFEEAVENWNQGVPYLALDDSGTQNLRRWKDSVLKSTYDNFTQVFGELLILLGYHGLDSDDVNHAVIMANLGRFNTLLTDYETAIMLGGRRRNWETDLKGLCWYLNTYASSKYEEQTGDDIGGVDAVQLVTIHQSKGLEWPLVFVPCMVRQRFPSSMVGRGRTWLLSPELFDVAKYEGDLESERKLMYVALTRAKDVAVVSYFTSMNGRRKGPSDFVGDIEELPYVEPLSQRDRLPDHDYVTGGAVDELRTFTAGEIVDYGKCGYFYRLRHLWGYQPGLTDYLGYGQTLHFCLREAVDLMKNEDLSPMIAVATAVDRNFYMPFMTEGRMEKIKHAAKNHLMRFAEKYRDDMLRIREVETRVEFPVQNAIVVGKVDVILHDGDAVEVRDYKTSDTATTPEDSALQVQLYTRGLCVVGETVSRGSVAFLEDAAVDAVDVTEQAVAETVARVEEQIGWILSGKFAACPGEVCERCDYQGICRWRA